MTASAAKHVKPNLPVDRLREVLHYDAESGVFTWRIRHSRSNIEPGDIAGTVTSKGYIRIHVDGISRLAHRMAWAYMTGSWPTSILDHIDGNRANNRIENLRLATDAMNSQNRRAAGRNNSLGVMGVFKMRGGYIAKIKVNGKDIYLGKHRTPEEAHAAYLKAKRELHEGCTL